VQRDEAMTVAGRECDSYLGSDLAEPYRDDVPLLTHFFPPPPWHRHPRLGECSGVFPTPGT
jgi:hypothetical protein